MYFYKRVLYTCLGFSMLTIIAVVIFLNGMSNYESSMGAPSLLEIKLNKDIKYSNLKRTLISSLSLDNFENFIVMDVNSSGNSTKHFGLRTSESDAVLTFPKSSLKEEMKYRTARVKELCELYHVGSYSWPNGTNDLGIKDPPTPLYSYFFFNKENRLAWCPVYKAGSTSFLYNMMILKGYSEDFLHHPPKQLSFFARDVYPEPEPGQDFDEAYKLLVVRHPFERLVSAFRDKLANSTIGLEHGTAHFFEKYGKKIVEKYREDKSIRQVEPIFEEFVRYLLKTELVYYADDHWLPAYLSCTPCRVSYDYILKVENYIDDQEFVIKRLNLSHLIKPKWKHRTDLTHNQKLSQSSSVSPIARKYFSQLTKSQVYSLYKKYFLDFELFNYSYKEYMDFSRKDD